MTKTIVPGLVSVVVASYNHAEFLDQRMDSLVAQTYPQIEILVIDDCSPDNSVAILQPYAANPRVKLVVREKNGGWVTVSNQGVESTVGEYVLFANCDDDCDIRMVECLVRAMEENPAAGVTFCRSLMIDEEGQVTGDDFTIREPAFQARCAADTLIDREEMRRFLLHSCVIPNLSAALIRRECFNRVGLLSHDYRACSDWDIFFRIADQFDFYYVAEPLNRFRQHRTTIRSATKGRVTYDEFFRLLLGQVRSERLSAGEKAKYRLHVMYLWAIDLLRPSTSGLVNFAHHFVNVARLDPVALLLLPVALCKRVLELPLKALARLR